MTQSGALVSNGVGFATVSAGSGLGAVSGAGCIIVGNILAKCVVAGTGSNSNHITGDIDVGNFLDVIIVGPQFLQSDLVITGCINGAGEGQQDSTCGNLSTLVVVAGPEHHILSPVDCGPAQILLQTLGDGSRACNIGHALGNNQIELQSRDAHTDSLSGNGVIDGITGGQLSSGCGDLNVEGRFGSSSYGNLTVGQLNGHLLDVVVVSPSFFQGDLMLTGCVNGAGEGQQDGALGNLCALVVVAGPEHHILSPVNCGPAQIFLQTLGDGSGASNVSHALGDDQVEL